MIQLSQYCLRRSESPIVGERKSTWLRAASASVVGPIDIYWIGRPVITHPPQIVVISTGGEAAVERPRISALPLLAFLCHSKWSEALADRHVPNPRKTRLAART